MTTQKIISLLTLVSLTAQVAPTTREKKVLEVKKKTAQENFFKQLARDLS
jgi:hypothetical protein